MKEPTPEEIRAELAKLEEHFRKRRRYLKALLRLAETSEAA